MKKLMGGLKAVEVIGLVNLAFGCGLAVLGICTVDLWTSVTASVMVATGIALVNLG